MKTVLRRSICVLLIGGVLMFTLSSCLGARYRVDYGGRKASFDGARDTYRVGAEVTLYYRFIATDTDYSFYVDGERINPDYRADKGYIISFTMPAHDVSVRVEARNSMVYVPETDKTAILTFDSFDGGGPSYSVRVADPSVVTFDQTKHYHKANHDEMTGAGFTVNITFFGLKPGKTTATVECRSPIADNFDAVYEVSVDEALGVTLTELEHNDIHA